MRLLSVDPSIDKIGIAIIHEGWLEDTYTFKTSSFDSKEDRLKQIARHFAEIGKDFDVAVVEYPDFFRKWKTTGKIKNFRELTVLHISIGAIVGGLSEHPIKVEFVTVSDWKGNTKKETTQRIVELKYGKRYNTHQSDAILMGMRWLQDTRFKNAARRAKKKVEKP